MSIKKAPLVSIMMVTYNHEKYLHQAIEGVLMQKVNFTYELLIHDDASTDNSAEIIHEYELKYPDIIKPLYQKKNQYSQGIDVSHFNRERAIGKYLAICEGDDYWIDQGKLQKQIDYLEQYPQYVGVGHNVYVIDEANNRVPDDLHVYPILPEHVYTHDDAIIFKHPGQSSSLVCRNIFLKMDPIMFNDYSQLKYVNGDAKLPITLTYFGDIYCLSDIMGCYRKILSSGSSWSSQNYKKNRLGELYVSMINLSKYSKKHFGSRLDNMELMISILIFSLGRYLSHPSKENRAVLTRIRDYHVDTIDLLRDFLNKSIKHPRGIFKNLKKLIELWISDHGKFTI